MPNAEYANPSLHGWRWGDVKADLNVCVEDAAYMAGFFDADGCVGITPSRDSSLFVLYVRISQVGPAPLYLFQGYFGGKLIGPFARPATEPNARPIYQWGVDARRAEICLRVIQPYLRLKHERVALALEFRGLFKGDNVLPRGREKGHPRNVAKRNRILRQRRECYDRMRVLNKRGISDERD